VRDHRAPGQGSKDSKGQKRLGRRGGKRFADRFNDFNDSFFGEWLEDAVDHFGMLAALVAIFLCATLPAAAQERVNPFEEPWKLALTEPELPSGEEALGRTRVPKDILELLTPEVNGFFVADLLPQLDRIEESKPAKLAKIPKKYDVNRIGERGTGGGLNFYSTDREIQLGKQLSTEIERSTTLFKDARLNEYVNRLVQNLVRNSDARVPFTVKIIDADEVNAFALPGGFMYVNTGLMLATESEAELAGVLAHEIAHVAARRHRSAGSSPG
jgi:hypothetical protein